MTILELMQKRNQALAAARNFAESHRTDKGTLSDEDSATYDKMEKEIMDMSREISRMQRQEAMEQELSQPVNSPITGRPYQASAEPEKKTGRASDEYRKGMLQALRTNFRQISNVLQEGIDENGGYLVPEEYDHRLIDVLNEENIMRRLGTTITTSGQHKINIAATKPAAAWIEEGGALTFGDATFDQIMLDAYKLHVAIKVTEQLLVTYRVERILVPKMIEPAGLIEQSRFHHVIHTPVDAVEKLLTLAPQPYLDDMKRTLLALFCQEGRIGATRSITDFQSMDNALRVARIGCVIIFGVKQTQFATHLVNVSVCQSLTQCLANLCIDRRDIVNTVAYGIKVHHAASRKQ